MITALRGGGWRSACVRCTAIAVHRRTAPPLRPQPLCRVSRTLSVVFIYSQINLNPSGKRVCAVDRRTSADACSGGCAGLCRALHNPSANAQSLRTSSRRRHQLHSAPHTSCVFLESLDCSRHLLSCCVRATVCIPPTAHRVRCASCASANRSAQTVSVLLRCHYSPTASAAIRPAGATRATGRVLSPISKPNRPRGNPSFSKTEGPSRSHAHTRVQQSVVFDDQTNASGGVGCRDAAPRTRNK